MANGQQKAQENLETFEVWKATQTDDDFTQIIFRGSLSRVEIAKSIGCGKSALNQNPALKAALVQLEDDLRDRGVLPPLTAPAKSDSFNLKQYDNTSTRAENEIHIVGSAEDLRVITEARSSSQLRNSYLVEMLKSIRNFKGFPHD